MKAVEIKVIIIARFVKSNESIAIKKSQRSRLIFHLRILILDFHQYFKKKRFSQNPLGSLKSNLIKKKTSKGMEIKTCAFEFGHMTTKAAIPIYGGTL